MTMTSYERYVAVCELREPDRAPVSPLIMAFAAKHAGISYGDYCRHGELMAEAQLQCIRRFGYDSVNVTADAVREAETLGAPVFWQEDEVPGPVADDPLVKDSDDLKRLRLPDPLGPNRMHEQIVALKILQDELGPDEVVYAWVEAPFQESAMLRGLSNLMTDLYERPALVHELMRFSLEMELEFGLAQVEAGARFIGVGDAIASLASPRHYREFNLPYIVELIARLKKTGVRGEVSRLRPDHGAAAALRRDRRRHPEPGLGHQPGGRQAHRRGEGLRQGQHRPGGRDAAGHAGAGDGGGPRLHRRGGHGGRLHPEPGLRAAPRHSAGEPGGADCGRQVAGKLSAAGAVRPAVKRTGLAQTKPAEPGFRPPPSPLQGACLGLARRLTAGRSCRRRSPTTLSWGTG